MRELLEAAANIIDQCADDELELGRTINAESLNQLAIELCKHAELRDELWAAAKDFSRSIDSDNRALQRLLVLCDRVAETET
jgi:hypothetical protein